MRREKNKFFDKRLLVIIVLIIAILGVVYFNSIGLVNSNSKLRNAPPSEENEEVSCPSMDDKNCKFSGVGIGKTLTEAYNSAKEDCDKKRLTCVKEQIIESSNNKALCDAVTGCKFKSDTKSHDSCSLAYCTDYTVSPPCSYRAVSISANGDVSFSSKPLCDKTLKKQSFNFICYFSKNGDFFIYDIDSYTCERPK